MVPQARRKRLLYLLALFQVLGGPAVLCGVIAFVRLANHQQLTFHEEALVALGQVDAAEVTGAESSRGTIHDGARETPQDAAPPCPAPNDPPNKKVKFQAIVDFGAHARLALPRDAGLIDCRFEFPPGRMSQPPPLRPPKLG